MGLIGWSAVTFERNDPIRSIVKIIVLTLTSFNLSTDYKSITEQTNWFIMLSALLGSVTTFAGVIAFAVVFSRERLLRFRAKFLFSKHVVVIGDTPLARRLTAWFNSNGEQVVQVVASGTESPSGCALAIGFDAPQIISATRSTIAKLVVIDLETDAATLALGQDMLLAVGDMDPSTVGHSVKSNLKRLALKVEDQVLSDQFLEFSEHHLLNTSVGRLGVLTGIFDEYRALARYTLARHPLFALARQRGQERVHAVLIGATELAERLMDQVLLTSAAMSLDLPMITILDRDAERRQRELRARRPGVVEQLPIQFVQFDIDVDLSAGANRTEGLSKLLAATSPDAISAIYVAFRSESDSLRTALLLRRHQERTGELESPIFYYQRPSSSERTFTPLSSRERHALVAMQAPLEVLVSDVVDPDGREELAQALHEHYLSGKPTAQASVPWSRLPDALRRANIRAADQVPALIWSLGADVGELKPGELPRLDQRTIEGLMETISHPATAEKLARTEHERWMIERKLDGWSYGEQRDDQKRRHPELVPWDKLGKSPESVRKDVEQIIGILRFLGRQKANTTTRTKVNS